MPPALPSPPLPIRVDVPADADTSPDLSVLPTGPGVFVLEAECGGTVAIAITADLRRRVRARLAATPTHGRAARGRGDEHHAVRCVRAATVGSAFEADWAYLQLARRRLPTTYGVVLDRWRGWFIHVDPTARFPRLVRTSTASGRGEVTPGRDGVCLGPFPDRQSAQRGVDLLLDLFDLCRYHHILVAAPDGIACAYKEMGRCPAPCDGTIPMDTYRAMVGEAIAFACAPARGTAAVEKRMRAASATLDFETAAAWRQRLETARSWGGPKLRFVDELERFRFVAVAPAERSGWARLLVVHGGWIAPWADVPLETDATSIEALWATLAATTLPRDVDLSDDGLENIGLVSWHLFRPRSTPDAAEFVPIAADGGAQQLAAAFDRLANDGTTGTEAATADRALAEREIDHQKRM